LTEGVAELARLMRVAGQSEAVEYFDSLEDNMDLAERLQKVITDSPLSIYRIAQESGVDQSTLNRFVAGERTISLETASRLARWAGLELRPIEQEPRS
jgi:hypothetical protein